MFYDPPLPFVKPSQTTSLSLPIRLLSKTISAVREAVNAFNAVLQDFGFFQKLAPYDPTSYSAKSFDPPPKFLTWLVVTVSSSPSQQFRHLLRRLHSVFFNFSSQTSTPLLSRSFNMNFFNVSNFFQIELHYNQQLDTDLIYSLTITMIFFRCSLLILYP